MKKKLIFATMVLPALFAACTADEMVESNSASLQGRALLDPITVNVVGGNADTRFSWNEASYGWNGFTAEDKFSAGLVDDADGAIQDKVMTNYVFSTADGSNYTTTSQMVEGAYLFYSYPGFETSAARAEVAFDLTSQVKVDLNNPAATVEENQLFVTPLYKLTKESANEKLNMEFVSYWSTAAIAVKNTSKQSFKLVRVLLSSTSNDFAVKGKISPTAMNTAKLVYSYDEESGEYVLPEGISADDIRTAKIAAGETKQSDLFVDCQSYEVAAGKSATIYIQVPAGVYTNALKVEIVAEVTADGVTTLKSLKKDVVKNAKSDSNATENDAVRFSRGKTTAVFGVKNGAPAAYELDDIELITADGATGLYASSYEDVYGYLTNSELVKNNTAADPLAIYNLGTLSLDDKLMTLLSRMEKHVKFINAAEIESESRTSATLNYAQFAAGATITKGSIEIGSKVKLPEGQNLTVNKGAAATVGTGVTADNFNGTIVNNGTLNMAGTTATAITCGKDAVINVTGDQNWTSGYAMAKTMTVSAEKTLTFKNDVVNAYGCTITNNGEIDCAVKSDDPETVYYTFTNNGTITNNGVIKKVDNKATFESGTATTGRNAVIDNYGVVENVYNKSDVNTAGTDATAIINMKSADAEIKAVTGDGEIDNTIGGFITSNTGNTVKAVYTGDQSGMLGNVMAVTKIEVTNGTWSKPEVPANLGELSTDGVTIRNTDGAISLKATTLNLKNSPSISAKGGVTLDATNIDLSGSTFGSDVTITTATAATLANVTFNGQLTANSLASLALKGTVFNKNVSATDATTITVDANTDNNDEPVATTSTVNAKITANQVSTLTVNNKATLEVTVNGEVGKVGSTTVTVNAGGTVTNKGNINGQAAATVNSGGTWKGNGVKTA